MELIVSRAGSTFCLVIVPDERSKFGSREESALLCLVIVADERGNDLHCTPVRGVHSSVLGTLVDIYESLITLSLLQALFRDDTMVGSTVTPFFKQTS